MEFAFYFAAGVAVLATFRVITNSNPVHALLYLVILLLLAALVAAYHLGRHEAKD